MRLAFFIFRYFPHGGLQRDFLNIAELCRNRGHDVLILTMEWEGERPPGLDITVVNIRNLTNHGRAVKFAQIASSFLRDHQIDVAVGFNKMPGLDVYYAGDPCYIERIRRKYPSGIETVLRLTPRYRNFRWLEQGVFHPSRSTKVLLLTAAEEQYYQQYYGTQPDRFYVLPPGILSDRLAPINRMSVRQECRNRLGLTDQHLCLLLIGSAFKTKGLGRALYALASLPRDLRRRTRLLAVGDSRIMRFRWLARWLRVHDHVMWLPARDDIPELIMGADALLHPAVCDATGGVILEAMVGGLPVLTTEVSGFSTCVRKAQAGMVMPSPFQQEQLNVALVDMLTSKKREMWSQNGQTFTQQQDLQKRFHQAADIIEATAKEKMC
jgi:UDP-glucose:(heptosyl)LPS alpha-1,3-glucosyltransferase